MTVSAASLPPSTDLTSTFNALLSQKGATAVSGKHALDVDTLDGFLKEAYRINSHIASLHKELKDVRQAYLSTAPARRIPGQNAAGKPQVLTDREREDVDVNAKQMIRELNASIRGLDDAEQLRRETDSAIVRKKFGSSLGALASWASGDGASRKTAEHAAAEAQSQQTGMYRDGILWFLRQRLEHCCRTQQDMMESRLSREMEKTRGMLVPPAGDFADFQPTSEKAWMASTSTSASDDNSNGISNDNSIKNDGTASFTEGLTQEQVQMFEQDNQDMVKHYESTLDKVRSAEQSLVEISELQSLLVNNLTTQSAHIEQLVSDSLATTDNVGGGNKELKKAAQRPSAARYTFFAASGLCAFLVIWDLII
ncbi:hypothetical protein E4U35_003933 [Claviceps purpurea]|nr:hypothetical protein E4U35_003933 [Claviceps purpurea]KAG6259838.1 hypothetical protein E4U49_005589 [Claviceps purpurea]KAG6269582.1 hypothetical protein E4U47_004065 [Claviceps purpurea]KAG6292197.1 hypothetical protein E4U46_000441 [Claviceps purpurea]